MKYIFKQIIANNVDNKQSKELKRFPSHNSSANHSIRRRQRECHAICAQFQSTPTEIEQSCHGDDSITRPSSIDICTTDIGRVECSDGWQTNGVEAFGRLVSIARFRSEQFVLFQWPESTVRHSQSTNKEHGFWYDEDDDLRDSGTMRTSNLESLLLLWLW